MPLLKHFLKFKQCDCPQDPSAQQQHPPSAPQHSHEGVPLSNYSTQDLPTSALDGEDARVNFITKLCLLLGVQFLATYAFVAGFAFVKDVKELVKPHYWIISILAVVSFMSSLILLLFEKVRHKQPWNFVFLTLDTLSFGSLIGMATSYFKKEIIIVAISFSAGICLAVITFSLKAKCDFTLYHKVLEICLISGLAFIILAFIIQNRILNIVIAFAGVVLLTLYLAVCIQMTLGNTKMYYRLDDFVLADLNLYREMIMIFWGLLLIIYWIQLI